MALPVIKLLLAALKYASKPLNKIIITAIKARNSTQNTGLRYFFIRVG